MIRRSVSLMFVVLGLSLSAPVFSRAQTVSIPDPGLDAAIRQALQKPSGPLTPEELLSLTILSAGGRNISSVEGLEAARNLKILDLDSNSLTDFPIADVLTNLTILDLFRNNLTRFVLSNAPPNLKILDIAYNSLAECFLPAGLTNLDTLFVEGNLLTHFDILPGLANLTQLDVSSNQLTALTLPPGLNKLTSLRVDGNPLTTLVLSEPLAATNLSATVATLKNQGANVFTYPLTSQLVWPRPLTGAFQVGITGPPGVYGVFASSDLAGWREVGITTNLLGSISFIDETSHDLPEGYYRTLAQTPPANMVFIRPNTFIMGSPTNELHRAPNEGPQTVVTLTHGFWMGKFEVTQREYLSVMNTNPSNFPGDLDLPVSSVSWSDATNYCWKLTQRELAAGRIPPGSQYRLPAEAEWECAARAGTTARFSYGDDLDYTNLSNHAWYILNSGFPAALAPHPVGQKLPNSWGLYDMTGNVWEWCQDWLGDLPGGTVIDPAGPSSSSTGLKVVRGGSYDFDVTDCRSARRFFSAGTDTDIGFRVVLAQ